MTTPPSAADAGTIASIVLPANVRARIFVYLGGLIVLHAFASPSDGLMDVPISFFLKNRLHLSASEVATFRLVAGIPLYLSFLFGLVRDTWHPFGLRDRGLMATSGLAGAATFAVFALLPVTTATLLAMMLLATTASLFIASAQSGLTSALGQQHAMSGQVSAVWNIFSSLPGIAALLIGGYLSTYLEGHPFEVAARALYLAGAVLMLATALYCVWRPAAVYDNLHATRSLGLRPLADLKRLATHRPVWSALGIWLLWNFAPGSTTPLQFHLQNSLGADDAQWGAWNAIFAASFLPTFALFAVLCQRVPLRVLLLWGTLIAIPQFVPLLLMQSATGALVAAVPIGLMGGIATAAYTDLLIRSSPRGLEGTMLMMSGGLYYVSGRFGDVLGTWLYEATGTFTICVAMITAVYATILVVLRFVPPDLVATRDGQPLDASLPAA